MKTYTEITKTVNVIDKVFCDICGNEFIPDIHRSGYSETTIIRHRRGEEWPEGGQGDELDLDVCNGCMNNIIVPFLKSVGKTVEYREWDW